MTDITDKDEAPIWHETEILEWFQVERFFEEYGSVMLDRREIRWYQESWGALKRANLASHTEFDDDELAETVIKLRAVCLLAMYLGIYQAAGQYSEWGGDFCSHEFFESYLESLNVDIGDIWFVGVRKGMLETSYDSYEEDEEADDEQLNDIAMQLVREDNGAIFSAIRDHYGGNTELFVSLWNSRFTLDEIEPKLEIVNYLRPGDDGKLEVWAYVENGMKDWSWI